MHKAKKTDYKIASVNRNNKFKDKTMPEKQCSNALLRFIRILDAMFKKIENGASVYKQKQVYKNGFLD